MRVLVCGPRDWKKPVPVDVVVGGFGAVYGPETVIIEGEAPGVDSMAASAAHRHGLPFEGYPADWDAHGRAAGPIRNRRMLVEGRPELVVAFVTIDATLVAAAATRGTGNMVQQSRAAGVPVYVVGRVVGERKEGR